MMAKDILLLCSKEEEIYMIIMACCQITFIGKWRVFDTLVSDTSSVWSVCYIRYSSAFFKTDLENIKPYPTVPSLEFLCATGWKTQALMVKSDLRHVTVIRNYALSLFSTTNEKCHFTLKLSLCFTVCHISTGCPSCPGFWKSYIYFGSFIYTRDLPFHSYSKDVGKSHRHDYQS